MPVADTWPENYRKDIPALDTMINIGKKLKTTLFRMIYLSKQNDGCLL
jgi:hypothetical protein